jgi:O-antigen ligase
MADVPADHAATTATAPVTPATRRRAISIDTALRWLAVLAVAAWTGYFLFPGMPQLSLHVFPQTLVFHFVVGSAAIAYVAYLAVTRRLPGGTPLDVAVLGVIAAYAIATWASVSWRASLEPALQVGIFIIAFYILSDAPLLDARALRRALMLAGGALSLYALWVVGNDYADYLRLADRVEGLSASNIFPPTVPRVHDVSDHPNVLAMVLTLVMPFFVLAVLRPEALWERVAGLLGLFAGGWAIFLTLSRGGWAGAIVGIALTVAGVWLTLRIDQRERAGERLTWETFVPGGVTPTAIAAVLGAAALAVFGAIAFVASSSTRPGWLFRSSLSPREDAWRVGRDIFFDHIWAGAGPNSFGLLYPTYSGKFIVHTQHAHNGFLQVADDAGLLGILALAGVAVAAAWILWRTWRDGALEHRLGAVACAAALIGFAVHNQVDAGNIWKAPGIALAFVGAIIARVYVESHRRAAGSPTPDGRAVTSGRLVASASNVWRRYGSFAVRVALIVLVFVPLVAWYRIDRAHYDYWQGAEKLNKSEPGAIEKLQAAVNADSSMMVYQLQLGVAQTMAYDTGGRSDDHLLDASIIHLERAAALDPRSDLAHANLARVYDLVGRDDDAAREAQIARLAVNHVTPVLLAGEVYEDIGRDADAISTYGQAVSMDGGLANSTFWDKTGFRKQHFDEILRASTIGLQPCTRGSYLVEAHRSDPSVSLDGLDQAAKDCQFLMFTGGLGNDLFTRTAFARILAQQGDLDGALGHLQFAVGRQPDFGPARTELGRVYAAQGNIDAARHEWLIGGQLDEAESLRLLGDTYPAGEVPQDVRDRLRSLIKTTGSSVQNDLISVLYFRMRYGRLSPVFPLIPATWQTALPRPFVEWQKAVDRWDSGQ